MPAAIPFLTGRRRAARDAVCAWFLSLRRPVERVMGGPPTLASARSQPQDRIAPAAPGRCVRRIRPRNVSGPAPPSAHVLALSATASNGPAQPSPRSAPGVTRRPLTRRAPSRWPRASMAVLELFAGPASSRKSCARRRSVFGPQARWRGRPKRGHVGCSGVGSGSSAAMSR
jgi:hypothetical protein